MGRLIFLRERGTLSDWGWCVLTSTFCSATDSWSEPPCIWHFRTVLHPTVATSTCRLEAVTSLAQAAGQKILPFVSILCASQNNLGHPCWWFKWRYPALCWRMKRHTVCQLCCGTDGCPQTGRSSNVPSYSCCLQNRQVSECFSERTLQDTNRAASLPCRHVLKTNRLKSTGPRYNCKRDCGSERKAPLT